MIFDQRGEFTVGYAERRLLLQILYLRCVMSLSLYSGTSLMMTCACLGNAFLNTDSGEEYVQYIFRSKLSVVVLLNQVLGLLVVLARGTQLLFLGSLTHNERALLKETLLNFALFKVMFVAAMLEHEMGELVAWLIWFCVIGLFKLLSRAAHERFIHLIGVGAPFRAHRGPLALSSLMFICNVSWALWVTGVLGSKVSTIMLLCFESLCLFIQGLNTLCRFGIHYVDLKRGGGWDDKGHYVYVVQFACDSVILVITLLHYSHILYILGISFTLIDVVLLFNMRMVFFSLLGKVRAFKTFSEMERELKLRFPTVELKESQDELCPICRETMTQAKKMPCDHLFHMGCIQKWLQNNQSSCPICRYDLTLKVEPDAAPVAAGRSFLDWIPIGAAPVGPETIDEVQAILPQIPRNVIQAELIRVGSREAAIENLLATL